MEDLSLRNSDLLDGLRHLHLVLLGLDFATVYTLVFWTHLFGWGCFMDFLQGGKEPMYRVYLGGLDFGFV